MRNNVDPPHWIDSCRSSCRTMLALSFPNSQSDWAWGELEHELEHELDLELENDDLLHSR
jgi:hypothetical protein